MLPTIRAIGTLLVILAAPSRDQEQNKSMNRMTQPLVHAGAILTERMVLVNSVPGDGTVI
jgi:hypothetical protein